MSDALDRFLGEIDRSKLRIKRPTKFVFLCGGAILKDVEPPAINLRDFLWRKCGLESTSFSYVLAESAQQLYRDSGYTDLISFEEDIARIAAVVLVISESAGSLAELGAFCSNPVISPVLRVIISENNFNQESFIRWGPVERVRMAQRDRVGVFPWIDNKGVSDLESSADQYSRDMVEFIEDHVKTSPFTMIYPNDDQVSIFYDIMWIVYLADAINPSKLFDSVKRIYPSLSQTEFRKKIYTLRVARWLAIVPFGGQDYYFLPEQQDPFQYGFREGVMQKEPIRRVLTVRADLFSGVPEGALRRVRETRAAPNEPA